MPVVYVALYAHTYDSGLNGARLVPLLRRHVRLVSDLPHQYPGQRIPGPGDAGRIG
jgi:hypothetical protein